VANLNNHYYSRFSILFSKIFSIKTRSQSREEGKNIDDESEPEAEANIE